MWSPRSRTMRPQISRRGRMPGWIVAQARPSRQNKTPCNANSSAAPIKPIDSMARAMSPASKCRTRAAAAAIPSRASRTDRRRIGAATTPSGAAWDIGRVCHKIASPNLPRLPSSRVPRGSSALPSRGRCWPRGHRLRLLVRPGSDRSNIADLTAELVEGDLRDSSTFAAAVAGCRYVMHVAADYRLWGARPGPDDAGQYRWHPRAIAGGAGRGRGADRLLQQRGCASG